MKVSEFINECNNFKYSKEYFDLYKEESEINVLNLYIESYYYTEDAANVEETKKTVEKKEEGFFKSIWNKIKSLLTKFWNWVKSFFTKKKNDVTKEAMTLSDAVEKVKSSLISRGIEEKEASLEVDSYLTAACADVVSKLTEEEKQIINSINRSELTNLGNNIKASVSNDREKEYAESSLVFEESVKKSNVPKWLEYCINNSQKQMGTSVKNNKTSLYISIPQNKLDVKYKHKIGSIKNILKLNEFLKESETFDKSFISRLNLLYKAAIMNPVTIYLFGTGNDNFDNDMDGLKRKNISISDNIYRNNKSRELMGRLNDITILISQTVKFHNEAYVVIKKYIKRIAFEIINKSKSKKS